MKRLGTCLLLGLAAAAPVRADDLQGILSCMQAGVPPTLRVQKIELENSDRGGGASRVLKGRFYAMREKTGAGAGLMRASLRIDAPDYLAGAAWLLREAASGGDDEMYLYLPSVHRVRRVVGDAGYDSLLGTNFSYVDFKQLQSAFDGVPARLEAPEAVEQRRPAWVVSFSGTPGRGGGYSSIRSWIDQKTCVTLKVDFFEGDKLRKELTVPASALRQAGNYWYPGQATMRDLRDNTSTQLRILEVSSSGELASHLFDPAAFHLTR